MKLVKDGKVYDLDSYVMVCSLPSKWEENPVGNVVNVHRTLCMDRASGAFFVLERVGYDYTRAGVKVTPVSKADAARTAEDLVDYDKYVEVFGEPYGGPQSAQDEIRALKARVVELEEELRRAKA